MRTGSAGTARGHRARRRGRHAGNAREFQWWRNVIAGIAMAQLIIAVVLIVVVLSDRIQT